MPKRLTLWIRLWEAGQGDDKPKGEHNPRHGKGGGGVTPEQESQGKIGENEIKRRLEEQPDGIPIPGHSGVLRLIADRRDDGCGYDFLCSLDTRQVKLEVKTFMENGRIVVTWPRASRGNRE